MWRVTQVFGQWVTKHRTGYWKGPTTICCKQKQDYATLPQLERMLISSHWCNRTRRASYLCKWFILLRAQAIVYCINVRSVILYRLLSSWARLLDNSERENQAILSITLRNKLATLEPIWGSQRPIVEGSNLTVTKIPVGIANKVWYGKN